MPTQENGDIESAKTAKDYKSMTEEPVQAWKLTQLKLSYKRLPWNRVEDVGKSPGIIFACGLLLIFILWSIPKYANSRKCWPPMTSTTTPLSRAWCFRCRWELDSDRYRCGLERSTGDLNYGFMQFLYKSTKSNADIFIAKNAKEFALMNSNFITTRKGRLLHFVYPQGCKNATVQAAPLQL